MLTLKTASHIATWRNLKSLHSCRASTGLPMGHLDSQRADAQTPALAQRELRRSWLARGWQDHLRRCRERRSGNEA